MIAPVLTTDRLTLRPFALADFEAFAALHLAERARLGWTIDSRDEAGQLFLAMAGEWALRGVGMWALERTDTGEFIGHAGFHHPLTEPEGELGWAVVAEAEGQGFAHDAALAARAWGYANGTTAPVSRMDARNARSIALAERLGAQLEKRVEFAPDAVALHYRHPKEAA